MMTLPSNGLPTKVVSRHFQAGLCRFQVVLVSSRFAIFSRGSELSTTWVPSRCPSSHLSGSFLFTDELYYSLVFGDMIANLFVIRNSQLFFIKAFVCEFICSMFVNIQYEYLCLFVSVSIRDNENYILVLFSSDETPTVIFLNYYFFNYLFIFMRYI